MTQKVLRRVQSRHGVHFLVNSLTPAGAAVGEDPCGGIADVTALPVLVRHPEIGDHLRLAGMVLLEDLPVSAK